MFRNREDAGEQLAAVLDGFNGKETVVLAIPRGGLPLGAIIASSLKAPLDVAITKKIGHPNNKEYAIGALSMEGTFINPNVDVSPEYIEKESQKVRKQVEERYRQYYGKTKPHDLKDKWVIIVDDGIATGSTVLATVSLVAQSGPKGIVVAVPVAPPQTLERLQQEPGIDRVVCLQTPWNFMGVGQFYEDFEPVSDREAITILEDASLNDLS